MLRRGAPGARSTVAVVLVLGVTGCGAAAGRPSARQAAVVAAGPGTSGPSGTRRSAAFADAEASRSFPLPGGVKPTRRAPAPGSLPTPAPTRAVSAAPTTSVSPGAPSDAQITRDLRQMDRVLARQRGRLRHARFPATLQADGTVQAPPGAPARVARVIAGANAIARYPYVYGGGHGSFVDSAYDCSGSLSYALAAGGLVRTTLTSGQYARWGAPGPGRYITVFANAGHTFMYVAGLRYDTSGRRGLLGSRWQTAPRSLRGFVARHPPGL